MCMSVWDILGNEYESAHEVYDGPERKVLLKGDTFVLAAISEDGMATVIKTKMSDYRLKNNETFAIEYDCLIGSAATGRAVVQNTDWLGIGNYSKKQLPEYSHIIM